MKESGWADMRSEAESPKGAQPLEGKPPGPVKDGKMIIWEKRSGWADLNRRPLRPKRSALANCATPRQLEYNRCMPNPSRNGHFYSVGFKP